MIHFKYLDQDVKEIENIILDELIKEVQTKMEEYFIQEYFIDRLFIQLNWE